MKLFLYDTYARAKREFKSITKGKVGLYCCGPTVYNYAHLGNLRTYLFEDVLRRVLESCEYDVQHVMNITDVGHLVSDADDGEDKMEKGVARTGKSATEIAELYTDAFVSDLESLNIKKPKIFCKATDHIAEQIEYISELENKGYTYTTSDGIYFDTSLLADYGHLARLDIEGLKSGARVEVGEKRQSTDFALWKFSPIDEVRQMEWESPWGKGFPGWHIECSAMAAKYLGPMFDIHCGGKDHIPIHHSNEIAQSTARFNTTSANYWMHGYFLQTKNIKMSKSNENFIRIQTLLDQGLDPLAFRMVCLMAHYRSDITFSWEILDNASTALNRLRTSYYSFGTGGIVSTDYAGQFSEHICNDLNTSQALSVLWDMLKSDIAEENKKATLDYFDLVLGLDLANWEPETITLSDEINDLLALRNKAREERNWAEADRIRDVLLEAGYEIFDTAEGASVAKQIRADGNN